MQREELKNDARWIGSACFIVFALLQLVYHRESPIVVARMTIGLFWLFVLPGTALLYPWKERIGKPAWLAMGTILGMGVTGMGSYYLGVLGLNIAYHTLVLPAALVAAAAALHLKKTTS